MTVLTVDDRNLTAIPDPSFPYAVLVKLTATEAAQLRVSARLHDRSECYEARVILTDALAEVDA